MSTVFKIEPSMLVTVENEQITTTSFQVTEAFNKRHDNVIRAIENLDIPDDFRTLNFEVCFKTNDLASGKPQKYYKMTKDGFVFLAMGFTGKKAAQFKVAYINAFNAMAEQLHQSEHEVIADLQQRIEELDQQSRRLSPEQAGHIQQVVIHIWKTKGIHFQTTYHNIKVRFNVDTYKNVLREDYSELCAFLDTAPIGKVEPKPQAAYLSKEQALGLQERIVMLRNLFHPMSEYGIAAQGIARILIGKNPRTGMTEPDYHNVLEPYMKH